MLYEYGNYALEFVDFRLSVPTLSLYEALNFEIHNNINPEGNLLLMLRKKMDENAAFPVANFIGIILGFVSLSAFFIMQSLTVLLPLLFAPMVCITLSYLLYVSHRSTVKAEGDVTVNPVRVDLL